MVKCKFKIEGEVFDAQATVRKNQKDTGARVKNIVRNTMMSRLRTTFSRMLRGALGGGVAGSIGQQAGTTVFNDKVANNAQHTRSDKERAVVEAFQKITFNLYFDEDENRWKVARKLSEFSKRLSANPITKPYDQKTLARMLVEMAKADGSIAEEEKEFFQEFLTAETGSFSQLMRMPALSQVECEEVTKEAKENVFMIVAAVALTDNEFDDEEEDKLMEYGEWMGLKEQDCDELLKIAQNHTIEAIIQMEGDMSRDALYDLADSLGMERADAERAQIRFTKRLDG